MRPIPILVLASLLLLAACGDTRIERTGNGAAIGAATGAVLGGVCCGDPVHGFGTGALVGAAIGGALGALSPEPIFFNDHPPH